MKLVAIIIAFVLFACSSGHRAKECATLPALSSVPPTINVAPSATPCILSPRPQPFQLVGFPSEDGSKLYVTKTDLAALVVWLSAMDDWAASAALCLETRR